MSSFRKRLILFAMGSMVLLTLMFMVLYYLQAESASVKTDENKARSDLNVVEAIVDLKYPGPWNIRRGELYKGETNITNNFVIVDNIQDLTGDNCAIFLKNICVSTTVPEGECNRAVGTYAPYEVTSKILEAGQTYTGRTELAGQVNQIAYKPIKSEYGEIIGVLYLGVPVSLSFTNLYNSIKVIGITGLILTLLVGLIICVIVDYPIKKTLREVRREMLESDDHRGGKERSPDFNLTDNKSTLGGLNLVNDSRQQKVIFVDQLNQKQLLRYDLDEENNWLDTFFCGQQELPKGLNPITLKQIALFLKQKMKHEITIQDISQAVHLSKVTVRNYLDYLYDRDLIDIEQKYGSVGRPLRIYRLKT